MQEERPRGDIDASRPPVGRHTPSVVALGAQLLVALLHDVADIEVGEGGHAQCLVPRGEELPVVVGAVGNVDAWAECPPSASPRGGEVRAVVGHQPQGQRKRPSHQRVLGIEAGVGAVGAMVIPSVRPCRPPPLLLVEQATVGRAPDALLAQVAADGGGATNPGIGHVEGRPAHEEAMAVLALGGSRLATHELVVVGKEVAIEHGAHREASGQAPHLPAYGGQQVARLLILVVVLRAVERVGTIVLRTQPHLPVEVYTQRGGWRVERAAIVSAGLAEVAVVSILFMLICIESQFDSFKLLHHELLKEKRERKNR